jgi:hypothetical protein
MLRRQGASMRFQPTSMRTEIATMLFERRSLMFETGCMVFETAGMNVFGGTMLFETTSLLFESGTMLLRYLWMRATASESHKIRFRILRACCAAPHCDGMRNEKTIKEYCEVFEKKVYPNNRVEKQFCRSQY